MKQAGTRALYWALGASLGSEQPLLLQPCSSQVHFVTDSPVFEVMLKAVKCFNGTDGYRPQVEQSTKLNPNDFF